MSKKVIICDDEEGIRESFKLILGNHYDLILTASAEECLGVLKNAKDAGVALVDIKMPKVNGLGLLQQIKSARKDVKVIIVTGYKSVETASQAASLGADGYIVKPFKPDEILETVKKNI